MHQINSADKCGYTMKSRVHNPISSIRRYRKIDLCFGAMSAEVADSVDGRSVWV